MSIDFHCPKCGKHIQAPDSAGGKRGKCPGCEQSVYIPTPIDDIEPLDFAPVDPDEEAKQKELIDETRKLADMARHADSMPEVGDIPTSPVADGLLDPAPDVEIMIIEYARNMAEGYLTEADKLANMLRDCKEEAEAMMQQLTLDEMSHPRLSHIPRPVLVGFFKQLRAKW